MAHKFFSLVPESVKFEQFWVEIRKRNRWLILLRYGAVAMLTSLTLSIFFLQNYLNTLYLETKPLWLIAGGILLYNLLFHKLWSIMPEFMDKHHRFHGLHFSLLQIITDLVALLFFIYFTGGVETPLYVFVIFHVIIGSLFLPGSVIGLIVSGVLLVSITGSLLEWQGIIQHHAIKGFLATPLYNNMNYIIVFFVLFGISLFLSIYLANSIAKQLYLRERSLTKAYADIENAEKTKSRYVISIVHDLKTPIAAVITYLNMILDGTLGEINNDISRPLERSKIRLGNAIDTINDILHISQLKLETSIENLSDVDLIKLIDEIYSEMRVLINSKRISFNFVHEFLPKLIIKAEPKLLKLAIANLLSNAYKYTESDGKIEVIINDSKDYAVVSVTDNGIGIPDEDKKKIFQEFYRTALTKKKGIEGTGLGMSIVMNIIQRYHGEINVKSPSYLTNNADRPGTQFILRLPKNFVEIDKEMS